MEVGHPQVAMMGIEDSSSDATTEDGRVGIGPAT